MIPEYDQQLIEFLKRCSACFRRWPSLAESADSLDQLAATAPAPFKVAIVGRMKAGKSTLINSLIGEPLAITGTEEATATLNVISYGTSEQSRCFIAKWKDGTSTEYPIEQLQKDWSGESAEVIELISRLEYLQLFSPSEKLRSIEIIDTPGTGSAVKAHEAVTRDFLRPESIESSREQGQRADAIIYVISSAGREADQEVLDLFGGGRFSSAGPYNSICVFHKWDACAKALGSAEKDSLSLATSLSEQLYEQMKDKFLSVLPVSAPLALASRHAPDRFFDEIVKLWETSDAQTFSKIDDSREWDEEPGRKAVRSIYNSLPQTCFFRLVHFLVKNPARSGIEARQMCLNLSLISTLEEALQRNFFANAMVIKQCQLLRKASAVIESGFRRMIIFASDLRDDAQLAAKAAKRLNDPDLAAWAERMVTRLGNDAVRLDEQILTLSKEWEGYRWRLELLQQDLRVLRSLYHEDSIFDIEHHDAIRRVCRSAGSDAPAEEVIDEMNRHYRSAVRRMIEKEDQDMMAHLISRLQQAYQNLKNHGSN